ncbi:relaxase/mobilization nuclease domain-containing protein [Providencia stuartii]|uniref:relaxase/mobilization nuclease domain-containing protein n=1 Tax=Providencia stuartii TaxID=588 RepID=UPI00381917EA
MIVGFSSYGQGSGNAAIDYLTDKDRTTEREENPPQVIKGDIESTKALINSLDFQHKYTSGVLSFSPDEKITPEMEKAIIERFEQVAFAGMEKDRYDISWVRHSHAGHHELHFITPRVDLETGKSFNIKQPGKETQAVYDDFRSEINARYGLSSPDDPSRKRDIALSSGELKAKLTDRIDVKETVNEILDRQVIAGVVKNRADVVDSLKEMGFEINREGKNYLSIKDPESGEKFRLKGTIYERDFTHSGTLEKAERERTRDYSKPDERIAGEFAERVNRHIEKRAEYNANRYGKSDAQDFKNDIGAERLTALVSRDFPVSRHGDRDLVLHGEPEQRHHAAISRETEPTRDSQQINGTTSKHDETMHERQRERILYADRPEQYQRDGAEKEQVRVIPEREEIVNDRTGEESIGFVRSAFREIEDAADQNGARIESIGAEFERQGQQDRELIDAAQRFADTLRQHLAAIERYVIARITELKEKRLAMTKESQQKVTVKPEPLPQKSQQERLPTIDGKEFDRLIVVPVIKNDGFEKTIEFKAGFYRNDAQVSEVKHLTKPDMERMGIESKDIESRKVISLSELRSSQIESPLRHAERTLNEFKANIVNKEFSADEFRAMKAERARLEDNVMQIRKTIDIDKPKQEKTPEKTQGFTM